MALKDHNSHRPHFVIFSKFKVKMESRSSYAISLPICPKIKRIFYFLKKRYRNACRTSCACAALVAHIGKEKKTKESSVKIKTENKSKSKNVGLAAIGSFPSSRSFAIVPICAKLRVIVTRSALGLCQ